MRSDSRLALVLAGALVSMALLPGCTRQAPPAHAANQGAERVIVATPVLVTPTEPAKPTAEEFEHLRELLLDGQFGPAALGFDDFTAKDPEGPLAALALFNAGLAWEGGGDRPHALERYRSVVLRYPATEAFRPAAAHAMHLHAYLEQWSELSAMADLLLQQQQKDLSDVDKLDADGAKALSLVEIGDPDAAERYIARGHDIIDALRLGEGGKLPTAVAQIDFALGEVRKARSESIHFVPLPADFADALERRCQGLLDAQSAFSDAMRSYDAHWSAMSGFRVGELYQKLHDDVMAVPPPKTADTEEKKQLFLGAMRLRYRVLLEKGMKMMDHTVMLGERTGEASAWIDRAKKARAELVRTLEQEKSALAKLPFSESDLQKALDDLARPHAKPASNRPIPARHP